MSFEKPKSMIIPQVAHYRSFPTINFALEERLELRWKFYMTFPDQFAVIDRHYGLHDSIKAMLNESKITTDGSSRDTSKEVHINLFLTPSSRFHKNLLTHQDKRVINEMICANWALLLLTPVFRPKFSQIKNSLPWKRNWTPNVQLQRVLTALLLRYFHQD